MGSMTTDAAAGVSTFWLEVGGLNIRCLAAGTGGPPLLLLHGGGFDSADLSYRPVLPALGRTHRVFAPDLPGYGESDKPDLEYDLGYYIDFLGGLLDALGLWRGSLLGLSLGGGAALGFALRSPSRVDKLVLVAGYGLGNDVPFGHLGYLAARTRWAPDLVYGLMSRSNRALRWGLRRIVRDRGVVSEELVQEARRHLRDDAAGHAFGTFRKNEVSWGGLRSDYSVRLHELRCPTLLIHGLHDRVIPVAWSRTAQASIRESELHVFDGCGHWPPRECPQRFAQTVTTFLNPRPATCKSRPEVNGTILGKGSVLALGQGLGQLDNRCLYPPSMGENQPPAG